jgi:hypothetical protein
MCAESGDMPALIRFGILSSNDVWTADGDKNCTPEQEC